MCRMQTYEIQNYIANIMIENKECKHKQNSFCYKVITPLATIATIENTRCLATYYSTYGYCILYTNIYPLMNTHTTDKISLIQAKVYSHFFI